MCVLFAIEFDSRAETNSAMLVSFACDAAGGSFVFPRRRDIHTAMTTMIAMMIKAPIAPAMLAISTMSVDDASIASGDCGSLFSESIPSFVTFCDVPVPVEEESIVFVALCVPLCVVALCVAVAVTLADVSV